MNVKICGVCRPADAAAAAEAGAAYIGVILAPDRQRSRTLAEADAIYRRATGVRRVGVFADQDIDHIVDACTRLRLDVVQLHGSDSAEFAAEVRRRASCDVWKKVTVTTPVDLVRAVDAFGDVVQGLLLDSPSGGTGRSFDWTVARDARSMIPPGIALIIAGGLNPDNVGEAIAMLKPDIVDVASGVEQRVGEKSRELIDAFIRNALR